jgi:hypothetical protein
MRSCSAVPMLLYGISALAQNLASKPRLATLSAHVFAIRPLQKGAYWLLSILGPESRSWHYDPAQNPQETKRALSAPVSFKRRT